MTASREDSDAFGDGTTVANSMESALISALVSLEDGSVAVAAAAGAPPAFNRRSGAATGGAERGPPAAPADGLDIASPAERSRILSFLPSLPAKAAAIIELRGPFGAGMLPAPRIRAYTPGEHEIDPPWAPGAPCPGLSVVSDSPDPPRFLPLCPRPPPPSPALSSNPCEPPGACDLCDSASSSASTSVDELVLPAAAARPAPRHRLCSDSPVRRGPFAHRALSVRVLLIVPTLLTLLGSNIFVWYLGYRSYSENVERLSGVMERDLLAQLSLRSDDFVDGPAVAARAIADEFLYGRLVPSDQGGLRTAMWSLMKNRPFAYSVTLGFENGYALAYGPDGPQTVNPAWGARGYQYSVTLNATCANPNLLAESFTGGPLPNFVLFNAGRSGTPEGAPVFTVPNFDVRRHLFYETAAAASAPRWSPAMFGADGALTLFRSEPLRGPGPGAPLLGVAGVGVHAADFGDAARTVLGRYGPAALAFAIERRPEQFLLFTTLGSATRHVDPAPGASWCRTSG
eukprot:tig00000788_g4063.t1